MRTGKLTVKKIESILAGHDPKRHHGDGGGLWLIVGSRDEEGKPQAASYVYRYMLDGKSHEIGLGSASAVSLAKARKMAQTYRERVVADKVDVAAEKKAEKTERRERAKAAKTPPTTFQMVAESLMDARDAEWRNHKSRASWVHTLRDLAYPVIGDIEPSKIDTAMVVKVLEQPRGGTTLWLARTETAARLRGRIEAVLDRAKVLGLREGENPARWKGHLEHLLPKKSKVAPVVHHAALDYRQIGAFVAELRQPDGTAARALEFLILNLSRRARSSVPSGPKSTGRKRSGRSRPDA